MSERILKIAWCTIRSRTHALLIRLNFGSVIQNCVYWPWWYVWVISCSCSSRRLSSRLNSNSWTSLLLRFPRRNSRHACKRFSTLTIRSNKFLWIFPLSPPPKQPDSVSLVHHATEFYGKLYRLASSLSKRDRHGIYARIEQTALIMLELSIEATFEERTNKPQLLKQIRIRIETLKRLVRIMSDQKIIADITYLDLEHDLQSISKMAYRWLEWLVKNSVA